MAEGKTHLSIVICGHVDSGKSTTSKWNPEARYPRRMCAWGLHGPAGQQAVGPVELSHQRHWRGKEQHSQCGWSEARRRRPSAGSAGAAQQLSLHCWLLGAR